MMENILSTNKPHILIVDDDRRLRDLLHQYLSNQGFTVTIADSAADARVKISSLQFDVMIIDWMMPDEDGISLLTTIKPEITTQVLMLTALDDPDNRVKGLSSGADDYLSKPFDPRELVLRLQKLLQRQNAAPLVQHAPPLIYFGSFVYERERRLLKEGDRLIKLTTAEANLLSILASSLGQPLPREEIVKRLSDQSVTERSIDVQINRLRRKIEPDPTIPRYLQTVRNRGYVLIGD